MLVEKNVALNTPINAVSSLGNTGQEPWKAVDGDPNSQWNARDWANAASPQWIEIDLLRPYTIERIRLLVEQSPAGDTIHNIWGKETAASKYQLLHQFSGFTDANSVLEHTLQVPNIQFVKVETVDSPSWVAWDEIEIYALVERR